jgi:hypothetical protein
MEDQIPPLAKMPLSTLRPSANRIKLALPPPFGCLAPGWGQDMLEARLLVAVRSLVLEADGPHQPVGNAVRETNARETT